MILATLSGTPWLLPCRTARTPGISNRLPLLRPWQSEWSWYFSTELAENPAEVKFLWYRWAVCSLVTSRERLLSKGCWEQILPDRLGNEPVKYIAILRWLWILRKEDAQSVELQNDCYMQSKRRSWKDNHYGKSWSRSCYAGKESIAHWRRPAAVSYTHLTLPTTLVV